jgi:SAM-dependent methyltransferase
MKHGGLDELRNKWDAVSRLPDQRAAQKKVAHVGDGETFSDSGKRAFAIFQEQVHCNPKLSLLEFGCGLGRVTRFLAGQFAHVYAVDIAPGMVKAVDDLLLDDTTAVCSGGGDLAAKGVPLVDIVYSDSVLLHNRKDDVRKFWPSVMARLRPGGLAYFQVPCYEVGHEPDGWIDVGVWTRPELMELARLSGCVAGKVWVNPGKFSYENIGPVHHKLHVFSKK